jgi:hypothetical protein
MVTLRRAFARLCESFDPVGCAAAHQLSGAILTLSKHTNRRRPRRPRHLHLAVDRAAPHSRKQKTQWAVGGASHGSMCSIRNSQVVYGPLSHFFSSTPPICAIAHKRPAIGKLTGVSFPMRRLSPLSSTIVSISSCYPAKACASLAVKEKRSWITDRSSSCNRAPQ